MPRLSPLLALGALVAVSAVHTRATPSDATDPWRQALTFNYNSASDRFATLHAENPADTRVAVAYASSLLVKQPRTESNIQNARDILLNAHNNAPASDENKILASYLLARVELYHLDPANPESARARLEQLRRNYPSHPLADYAALDLASLLAYNDAGPTAAALPDIEALLATVQNPGAARDLHTLLATLYLQQLKKPAAALPHFVAARAVGYETPLRNADLDLTIANLAAETGDPVLARKHYGAFIEAAPRDVRSTTVRRLIASLETAPEVTAR